MTEREAAVRSGLVNVAALIAAAVVGTLLCRIASGHFVPTAAYGQAVVVGSLDALFAIGLVLVYRANRVVNFAQGSLGVVGAAVLASLVQFEGWPFLLALPLGLAASAATGAAVEVIAVRRMAQAPRLALTVVTIGVGQVLIAVAGFVTIYFLGGSQDVVPTPVRTPLTRFEFAWSPLVFTGDHLLVIGVTLAVMAGLAVFFRRSSAGIAVRGAAQNSDRAELLGVSVNNLSSLVWLLAGLLSGLAAVLVIPITPSVFGIVGAGAASTGLLLRGLAAAVVGRMDNLPRTVVAAIGISIFDQAMFWAFDNTAITYAAMLGLIVTVLLFQRAKLARSDDAASWATSEEVRAVPHELRDVPQVRAGLRRARGLLVVTALAYPWIMSPVQTSLGSLYALYGIVVVSLVVLTGWGGQISLGQVGFVAVGAALGGALTADAGLPFLVALLLTALVGAGLAVLVGLPAMRIQGLFLAVTTLAFAAAVSNVVLNERYFGWLLPDERITRPQLFFVDAADDRVYFYLCAASLAFTYWAARGIRSSRAGRVLIAMRDNERTAQSYGINRMRVRLATFAISGFLASFAGVLLVHLQYELRPESFAPQMSIQLFLLAVIGGLGSVGGALTGVLYFALLDVFLPPGAGQLLLSGFGVVGIMLFYPSGLGGLFFAGRDAWLRRVAMRARIYVPSLVGDHRVLDGEASRAVLAERVPGGTRSENEVPRKYRVASSIGVRGESQAAHRWRYR